MKVSDFLTFIHDRHVLQGFNLTKDLLLKLFAGLDCHRKGYLTLQDWSLSFSNYNCTHCIGNKQSAEQMAIDIKRTLGATFNTLEEVYNFMRVKSESEDVNVLGFIITVEQLLPARYTNQQLEEVWKYLVSGRGLLKFSAFESIFGDIVFRVSSSF